jgi:hypothetical protein
MPRWLKILLTIAIVVALLIVGVVGAGVIWWMKNKDAYMARAREVVAEGKEFGGRHDNQACVDETVSRYKKEPGFGSAMSNNFFLRSCLDASKPTEKFCESVPRTTEFIRSAEWQVDQCRRVDLAKDNYCRQLFQPVQKFCEKGPRTTAAEKNANE